ncbi:MAG: hypothetical protein JSR69_06545 [Proteobacteria bacterium]|nr:hypothetical protein [Pseudomonadota bacterium]
MNSPPQRGGGYRGRGERYVCLLLAFALGPFSTAFASPRIDCHTDYDGEARRIVVAPVDSPYTLAPQPIYDDFQLRVILRDKPADLAGVRIQVFWNRKDEPVMIQEARYPWPPRSVGQRYGFTGLQRIYEPYRDGELSYWCEVVKGGAR